MGWKLKRGERDKLTRGGTEGRETNRRKGGGKLFRPGRDVPGGEVSTCHGETHAIIPQTDKAKFLRRAVILPRQPLLSSPLLSRPGNPRTLPNFGVTDVAVIYKAGALISAQDLATVSQSQPALPVQIYHRSDRSQDEFLPETLGNFRASCVRSRGNAHAKYVFAKLRLGHGIPDARKIVDI